VASELHLKRLNKGVLAWNEWVRLQRVQRLAFGPPTRHDGCKIGVAGFYADLCAADLRGADLYQGRPGTASGGIDLVGADLRGAKLRDAKLGWAHLTGATLAGADLAGATLMSARLNGVNLSEADLFGAALGGAILESANLRGARMDNAYLSGTNFTDTDLTGATGLHRCRYAGPCTLDHRTLLKYDPLPVVFLRGCGLPEDLIEYLPSLRSQPLNFYDCFISYSSKDADFAECLYASLEGRGVRPFMDKHDLPTGAKTWDWIDQTIALREKVLLILSENSIASEWVEDEVAKAFAEERKRGQPVLVPIRLDDAVETTCEPWAVKIRDQLNIGIFCSWKNRDSYLASLEKLVRDLRKPVVPAQPLDDRVSS
jgi:uncharacterized protein YjbI with pentapeptide repeats